MTERTYTDAELRTYAAKIARNFRLPAPRTAADVSRITGEVYTGPDPEALSRPRGSRSPR